MKQDTPTPGGQQTATRPYFRKAKAQEGRTNRPYGVTWAKGVSGNPGGRPPGVKGLIEERVGAGGEGIVSELTRIAFDRKLGARTRLEALAQLGDRLWGRAPASLALEATGFQSLKFGGRFARQANSSRLIRRCCRRPSLRLSLCRRPECAG